MKKLSFILALVWLWSFLNAQNSFEVYVASGLSLGNIELYYSDGSGHEIALNASGYTSVSTGDQTVEKVIVNGTYCSYGITGVLMDDGAEAEAKRTAGRITFKAKEGATLH